MTVTHQRNQVHLASPQDTGMYEAKAMKSAQRGRIHQTLPLRQVPVCPHPGHGTAPCGSQLGKRRADRGGGSAYFYDNLLWQSCQPLDWQHLLKGDHLATSLGLGRLGRSLKSTVSSSVFCKLINTHRPTDFVVELCLWTNTTSPLTSFLFRVFGLVDSLPFSLWKLLKDCFISWFFKRQYTFRAFIYQSICSFSHLFKRCVIVLNTDILYLFKPVLYWKRKTTILSPQGGVFPKCSFIYWISCLIELSMYWLKS